MLKMSELPSVSGVLHTSDYYPCVSLLIRDALSVSSHPTLAETFIFYGKTLKFIRAVGTVTKVEKKWFNLTDDTGSIRCWFQSLQSNASENVNRSKSLLEKTASARQKGEEKFWDNSTKGYSTLETMMKRVVKKAESELNAVTVGSVIEVTGYLSSNGENKHINCFRISSVCSLNEADYYMFLMDVYEKWKRSAHSHKC